ncbi:MAG: aminopeptidase P family protein [Gracilimonas sp.]|uniref:M24 family metallopeptidase n=1 Tax=Gracilimonas TaxID=649462 RepID=UPI001B12D5DF|nr:M24 family metallopeptidase [Gracilimonas sp.]MBO6585183.1 aminopeptidase P family protein [Gracilimonas sp.]MBO6615545.1 aminopeptidase P family protein [Gracilimonas sp.]
MLRYFCAILIIATACTSETKPPIEWGESPWPEIRKERISTLLPQAMEAAGVDAWIVICRENNNDPIADHIGGENAGGTAAFLFYRDEDGFHSRVYSPVGEATALDELDIHDEVIPVERGRSAMEQAADFIRQKDFETIAVNSSASNAQADGLSFTQRQALEKALGAELSGRLVSSEELIYEWLSVKTPREVEIMTKAAELTAQWQLEAYEIIEPGVTTDAEVAAFLDAKMEEYGVGEAWNPTQNPNVNSGADRGHSHATDKVIMPGDVIQTDFGIKLYDRWVSDIQRFAYVLKEGETEAPEDIQFYWESAKAGNRAAFNAMKPGVRGEDVDAAQRKLMEENGSEYVMWSTGHPVGYVAHDTGPNLGGSHIPGQRPSAQKLLKPGMVFAFDGFHSWPLTDSTYKTISVEEMAVITEDGAEFLIPPQEEWILVE